MSAVIWTSEGQGGIAAWKGTEKTQMPYRIARFGWIPDLPDQRDHLYAAPRPTLLQLPSQVDLRPQCPPVYDQGQLGSCTANAIAGAFQFAELKEQQAGAFQPSRLFIYYNERMIEHTVSQDSGAQIRDGIKSVATQGVCPESDWPYDITQFAQEPTAQCYTDAAEHTVRSYQRLFQDLTLMKGCLAEGFPFVFGFTVYESFESQQVAQTGQVPMPATSETSIGGHAVAAVGYDDSQQWFIVRNSWGPGWGAAGYCYMPYLYLTQRSLASDFWTIRVV
jgi:C1A family cysteine protease